MSEKYDLAVLGGGPAGYRGALRAAGLGARVVIIEEIFLGGVCLNWGCIPTKTVRASAEVARSFRRAAEFGLAPVDCRPDLRRIIARKDRVVTGLRSSLERLLHGRRIAIVEGRGRLAGPGRIEVDRDGRLSQVSADKIVIATGSRPNCLQAIPYSPRIFLADEMLTVDHLPGHLLVVGGGAVGVEMAVIFRELGSRVTLVEAAERLLPGEDTEMIGYLEKSLRDQGIEVCCGAGIEAAWTGEAEVTATLTQGREIVADTVLVAAGRRYNTNGLGLEEAGVSLEEGRILVDEHLQTTAPGVYAGGDVIGGWLLAHVAFVEGETAAENALGGRRAMDYRVIPRALFTLPEYGAVGLTEEEAQVHYPVKVGRFGFQSLGLAQARGEAAGLVKIVAHAHSDEILGGHILGPGATELIAEIALAMQARLPSRMLADTLHAHPTLAEAVQAAAQVL